MCSEIFEVSYTIISRVTWGQIISCQRRQILVASAWKIGQSTECLVRLEQQGRPSRSLSEEELR